MKKNNKGFSLVELIIVIAIMAILVGVLAPNLIKQLEKAKVSSDIQLCDTIYNAIVYAIADPEVNCDANFYTDVEYLINPYSGSGNTWGGNVTVLRCHDGKLKDAIIENCGFDCFNTTLLNEKLRSTPASSSGQVCMYSTVDDFAICITPSDVSGTKHSYDFTDGMDKLICVPTVK